MEWLQCNMKTLLLSVLVAIVSVLFAILIVEDASTPIVIVLIFTILLLLFTLLCTKQSGEPASVSHEFEKKDEDSEDDSDSDSDEDDDILLKSFDDILDETPTIPELTEHINIGPGWSVLGTLLNLDQRDLDDIQQRPCSSADKCIRVFQLWHKCNPAASRRIILEALRKKPLTEYRVADEYEVYLNELLQKSLNNMATLILQKYMHLLKSTPFCLITVSQRLYSKRCISEAFLDEIEMVVDEGMPLDEKKKSLLSALKKSVADDGKKLREICIVLSDIDETRSIAQKIRKKYNDQKIKEESGSQLEPNKNASDILQNYYGALSQLIEPINFARLFNEEVISDEVLAFVLLSKNSPPDCKAAVLKAVRHAVRLNEQHLELLVTVLRKFQNTASIGDAIFEEYLELFPDSNSVLDIGDCFHKQEIDSGESESSAAAKSADTSHRIIIPRNMSPAFDSIRLAFGAMFYNIRSIFASKKIDPIKLKKLVGDCYFELKPQLKDINTIDDVLDVVLRKCSLINIRCLEVIITEFNVTDDALPYLNSYNEAMKEFCKKMVSELGADESLQVVRTPTRLASETVIFHLDWYPDKTTIEDIRDLLSEINTNFVLDLDNIKPHLSVVVTCYCPAEYIGSLIIFIQKKIGLLKKKGLEEFKVGSCSIWELNSHNDELSTVSIVEEISKASTLSHVVEVKKKLSQVKEERKKQLHVQRIMMSLEINDLIAILQEKGKMKSMEDELDFHIQDVKQEVKTKLQKTNLSLPCLGRQFEVGMLYDCRRDRIIPGEKLWDDLVLNAACTETSQPSDVSYTIITEDGILDKMISLNVESDFSLSLISGLIEAPKYLDDKRFASNDVRVTLKCNFTSKFEQLEIEHLAAYETQRPDIFEDQTATHVVVGVLYGAEVFFIFDREVASDEKYSDVQMKVEGFVKTIQGACKVINIATYKIKDDKKLEIDKLKCKFYDDLMSGSNESTYEDAVLLCNKLRTRNAVPIKVLLYPLIHINSRAACMVKEVSTGLVDQILQEIEILDNTYLESQELKLNNTEIFKYFHTLNDHILHFQKIIVEHKEKFFKKLSNLLVSIRGGEKEEQEIVHLLDTYVHKSPFSKHKIDDWIASKKEEIKVLQTNLNILKVTSGVRLLFPPHSADKSQREHDSSVLFEFKVPLQEDPLLHNMLSFLRNDQDMNPIFEVSSSWFKSHPVLSDLELKIKNFASFANANSKSKEVVFIATCASDLNDSRAIDKAAVIKKCISGTPFSEFDLPSKPEMLTCHNVEDNKVELQWKVQAFGSVNVEKYKVGYRSTDEHDYTYIITKENKKFITINQLKPETSYVFKVCAQTAMGHSEWSKVSEVVKTKAPLVNQYLQSLIAQSDIISSSGVPMLYQLKAKSRKMPKSSKHISQMDVGVPFAPHTGIPTRVLMVVGATGAGKSTLINGMVNYILGVKLEHDFRFKLIFDEAGKSQAHSQTQKITAYTIYWHKSSPLNCNLTIIDTPGFGDTRGLERDQEITSHIRDFFQLKGINSVDVLHGIGFVAQASLARLTATQQYIFNSILSIFGKDIKDNIFIMTTFADGADPPVMEAIKEANIHYADYFPFNNSALFVNPQKNLAATKIFWEMGISSFKNFFKQFEHANPVSLQLTRQVLEERHQLQVIIQGIQPQIDVGLSTIDELRQEEAMLKTKESEVLANKDFTYEVNVTKMRKINVPVGQYVTNCAECHFTCHKICGYANDRDKWQCSAMDMGGESNATCRVCPNRCSWKKHYNNGYYFEFYAEVETRTSDDLLQRYKQAKSDEDKMKNIIQKMEDELQELQRAVLDNINQARMCLKRLEEIALKPNPMTEVEYIDILIESQKQQKNTGWKNNVRYLQELRQQAEILARVGDPDLEQATGEASQMKIWNKITGFFKSGSQ